MEKVNNFLSKQEYEIVDNLLKLKGNDVYFQFTENEDTFQVVDNIGNILFSKTEIYE